MHLVYYFNTSKSIVDLNLPLNYMNSVDYKQFLRKHGMSTQITQIHKYPEGL